MPQFSPGEVKTAIASMSNPTGKGFSYTAELYLDVTKVASSGVISFYLAAGETRNISFPVTMPSAEGTYPVYLDVFVGTELVGAYRATEDVEIIQGILAGEIISEITWRRSGEETWHPLSDPMPAYSDIYQRCKIRNTGNVLTTFRIAYYDGKFRFMYDNVTSLGPGQEGYLEWGLWSGGPATFSWTWYLFGDDTQVHSVTITIRVK